MWIFFFDFVVVVGSSAPNGEPSTVKGDTSSGKADVLNKPSESDKPLFRNDELRAKRNYLFDVEGSLNFDSFCENGDIDLRWKRNFFLKMCVVHKNYAR